MSEYKFLESTDADNLELKVNNLAALGYEVVSVTQSEDEAAMHYLVCMKKGGLS